MGRPKGGKNRKYTPQDKEKIVKMVIEEHTSTREIERRQGISSGMISIWIRQYEEEGIDGFRNRRKGNPFSALHTSKSLTTEERLRLENMKLRIENERLKKGYIVKGVGVNKEYVSISDLNTKSSKR